MNWNESDNLGKLPPYIFSEINKWKQEALSKGKELLSLAIGDPDLPTPESLLKVLSKAILKSSNHTYSPYEGTYEFRTAAAGFLKQRFGVSVSPSSVIATIGSKEAVAHFPMSFCNAGDCVLYPSPGYPIFENASLLAGAKAIPFPHSARDSFQPNIHVFEKLVEQHHPKMVFLNYPSNPTSVVASRETLTKMVEICKKNACVIAYDNAYSEIFFDPNQKPISILEIEEANGIAIEFHSLSKSFNMTGWRLGFAVGNPELVKILLKYKTNIDSGPLLAVQEMGGYALENFEELQGPIRSHYLQRRSVMLEGLQRAGFEYVEPLASLFVWVKSPHPSSMEFCKRLIMEQGLIVTPGVGFGAEGEGFFRLSLTVPPEKIAIALERLSRLD